MTNNLDVTCLEPYLADDFHYASQWVCAEIESKQEYLDYIGRKLEVIRADGPPVWAEMGVLPRYINRGNTGPCVIIAQGDKDDLKSVVLVEVEGDRIKRMDMCGAVPLRRPADGRISGLDRSQTLRVFRNP